MCKEDASLPFVGPSDKVISQVSTFFCYGIDPLLDWLEKRLKCIPIYTMDIFNAPNSTETYKVMGYVDDIKPGITSVEEFSLVDRGSALFEAASGCKG